MTASNSACPHCAGEREPHLVPRNFLCRACQERATDVLGWNVRLSNGMRAEGGAINPVGHLARHADGSTCREVQERAVAYVDGKAYAVVEGRMGGVFLTPLGSTAPQAPEVEPGGECMERLWQVLSESLADDVRWLKDGDFLSVNYDSGDPNYSIYGQLAPEDGAYHCEVVSNDFMPADDWPLDAEYLQQSGWMAPDDDTPNWFRVHTGADLAAERLLLAMRYGRGCEDARRLDWEPARFPDTTEATGPAGP